MRLLHLVLVIVIALVSVGTIAAKTAMRSDSIHDTDLRSQIATRELESDEADSDERTGTTAALPPGVYLGTEFGGPHGNVFTDVDMVKSGQKVLSVSIRSWERVDAISLNIEYRPGEDNILHHGSDGGELNTTALENGEHITCLEANWGKHKGRTRIKYIKFTTNKGKVIEGGRPTGSCGVDKAKDGYQLGGFIGRSGDEIDKVGAIWTSIQPVV